MKRHIVWMMALLGANACALHRPPNTALAGFLPGHWSLAAVPDGFRTTSVTNTTFYPDGTWEQDYYSQTMHCGTDRLDTEVYYKAHPEAKQQADEERRQQRLRQRWVVQGRSVYLYERRDMAERLIATYKIRNYGLGNTALCKEECDESPSRQRAFLRVARHEQVPTTLWVRKALPQDEAESSKRL